MMDAYWRRARLISVVDGDTVRFHIDLGYRTFQEQSIRLTDIDAPDVHRGNEEMKQRGKDAKQFVQRWFEQHGRMNCGGNQSWPFEILSKKSDSFGRFLGVIVCLQGHQLNQELLESNLVKVFTRKEN